MMQRSGWPEVGDLVVCTVKKVTDFGAFVGLDEYADKEGLIHISEVASGWVKYIRDYVREGQKIVCKVLNVDVNRHHIDLSLKDVNEHQKREKIQQWKNEQKAERWLQYVLKTTNNTEDLTALADLFYDKFGSMYAVFENAKYNGVESLTSVGVKKEIAQMIARVADENIKTAQVDIAGYIDLTCFEPEGIDLIKKALAEIKKVDNSDIKIEISYIGAPRYRIHVIAPDYKKAENALKKSAMAAVNVIETYGGEGTFHRYSEASK